MKQNIMIGIFAVVVIIILVGAAGIVLSISPTTTTVAMPTTATSNFLANNNCIESNTATVLNPTTATQTATVSYTVSTTATSTVAPPTTRVITDMIGRNLTVPTHILRVLTTGPQLMELVYMLDPAALAGLSFTYNGAPTAGEAFPPLVPLNMTGLPVVGGWFGTQVGNYETFIGERPDVILDAEIENMTNVNNMQNNFAPIPVVEVDPNFAVNVTTYASTITFVGNLLGVATAGPEPPELLQYRDELCEQHHLQNPNQPKSDGVLRRGQQRTQHRPRGLDAHRSPELLWRHQCGAGPTSARLRDGQRQSRADPPMESLHDNHRSRQPGQPLQNGHVQHHLEQHQRGEEQASLREAR